MIVDSHAAYGWLKCEREEDHHCDYVLWNEGIYSHGGMAFAADTRYTRLSLIKTQDDFELLMKKMEAVISKEKHDSM